MTDAAEIDRARWAAKFADELLGFEPGPFPDAPEPALPLAPATRIKRARDKAAVRAQRARDRARLARELDAAIAEGLRRAFAQRHVYDRLRDGENFSAIAVCIEPVFGQAMAILVEECGWERPVASSALNRRLLKPAAPSSS